MRCVCCRTAEPNDARPNRDTSRRDELLVYRVVVVALLYIQLVKNAMHTIEPMLHAASPYRLREKTIPYLSQSGRQAVWVLGGCAARRSPGFSAEYDSRGLDAHRRRSENEEGRLSECRSIALRHSSSLSLGTRGIIGAQALIVPSTPKHGKLKQNSACKNHGICCGSSS